MPTHDELLTNIIEDKYYGGSAKPFNRLVGRTAFVSTKILQLLRRQPIIDKITAILAVSSEDC